MSLSRKRIEYAAEVFLASMRRSFITRHPDVECPVKTIGEYNEADRGALVKALESALKSSDPKADAAFAAWYDRTTSQT